MFVHTSSKTRFHNISIICAYALIEEAEGEIKYIFCEQLNTAYGSLLAHDMNFNAKVAKGHYSAISILDVRTMKGVKQGNCEVDRKNDEMWEKRSYDVWILWGK